MISGSSTVGMAFAVARGCSRPVVAQYVMTIETRAAPAIQIQTDRSRGGLNPRGRERSASSMTLLRWTLQTNLKTFMKCPWFPVGASGYRSAREFLIAVNALARSSERDP